MQWREAVADLAGRRLKSWGMNTIGNWSNSEVIKKGKMPYTGTLGSGRALRIRGSEGPWDKFPDPYDGSFIEAIRSSVVRVGKAVTDPYCMGFFVDNELYWGDDSYLAKAVIQSGKDQPAKIALCDYLKKKYGSIAQLNSRWQTTYGSWDAFMNSTTLPIAEPPLVFGSSTKASSDPADIQKLVTMKSYIEDTRIFSAIVANTYYRIIKESLARFSPHCLYLGCRFDFHYYPTEDTSGNWIVQIAAKYADVVSFNRYRYSAADLKPGAADVPVIIGEWSMGAMDHGSLHYGLRLADDQANRAEMYDNYVRGSLSNPYLVGVHWFTYHDEAVLGREDGED